MDSITPPLEQSPNWLALPPEITAAIFLKVGAFDILNNVQLVCTSWHTLCKDPPMWRSVELLPTPGCQNPLYGEMFARSAVERSCGQLIEISIGHFPSYEFIQYLGQSYSQIRRLRIVSCPFISKDLFKQSAPMFPRLEEFEIQSTPLTIASVEAIGNCCPQLKTFKCNGFKYTDKYQYDEDLPKVIAKTMPQLYHLELLRTKITNAGLKAILDGCPCLETLDLGISYLCNLKVDDLDEVCSARYKRIVRHRVEPPAINKFEREHIRYCDGPFIDDGYGWAYNEEEEEDDDIEDDYDVVEDDNDNNDVVDDDDDDGVVRMMTMTLTI